MKVFPTTQVTPELRQGAITIGNFDGCHLGHQNLIKKVQTYGSNLNLPKIVMTFDPNPKIIFEKISQTNSLLFTNDQKQRAFEHLDIDALVMQKFDADFRNISHGDFYERLLRANLDIHALVVGENFAFGKGRMGDGAFLSEMAKRDDVYLSIESAVLWDNLPISSHRIRTILSSSGDAESAAQMLGRPYSIEGVIGHGDKLGRRIGIPTANLKNVVQLIPKEGVYAGYIWYESPSEPRYPNPLKLPINAKKAVINIGYRPTLELNEPQKVIEGHILHQNIGSDELYDKKASFFLLKRIRDEKKFEGLAQLQAQIQTDIATAIRILSQ
ncbi:MAG: riboflavin biosynthesis protein RibF [Oligoflexales bacterium]